MIFKCILAISGILLGEKKKKKDIFEDVVKRLYKLMKSDLFGFVFPCFFVNLVSLG